MLRQLYFDTKDSKFGINYGIQKIVNLVEIMVYKR